MFWIRYGYYECCVIQLGLANTNANFQSYINKCLTEKLHGFVLYISVILLFTQMKKKCSK